MGDVVLHCGHVIRATRRFFHAPDGLKYKRPDGTRHVANWLVCCQECFDAAGGDPSRVRVKGDGVWQQV